MSLPDGTQLSHYRVLAPLGAGAMGEVYRARDSRLGREVAIKVLPAHFADEPERLARFEREARSVATLNHPNIAQIYGVDQDQGLFFLALELVPGESLDERLARGPLPIDEALDVCRQIAAGLEAAHEAGVIHRDLKPANVRVTPDGQVKLLDFGLAKSTGPAGAHASSTDSVLSTEAGRLLGTPTYMAPEQARGKPIDRRVDVWAFGCVLYECLTARRAYAGESLSDVLASVLEREPDWSALPPDTPPRVVALLRRCLTKDPTLRLRDAGEARVRLTPGQDDALEGTAPGEPAPRGVGRGLLAAAAGALVATALLLVARGDAPAPAPRPVVRTSIEPPAGAGFHLSGDFGGAPQLSPDGTRVAFLAVSADGQTRIWIRDLSDLEARPVPGTEGAYLPFWSPDGRSLGYFGNDELYRVDLDGGAPMRLAGVTQAKGGTWAPDGTIVFAPNFNSELMAVPAGGGEVRSVVPRAPGHTSNRFPQVLPDGEHFLYYAASHNDVRAPRQGVWVGSLHGDPPRFLLESRSSAIHAAGHLLFVRDEVLVAYPFDLATRTLAGEPRLLPDPVKLDGSTWMSKVGASADGTLVYQPANDEPSAALVWVDREGREVGEVPATGTHQRLRLSPDGARLALESQVQPNSDVWIYDLERGTGTKLTLDPSDEGSPTWSPDGTRVAYQSNRGDGTYRVYTKHADGAAAERMVYESTSEVRPDIWPLDWSSDGRFLFLVSGTYGDDDRGRSLYALELEGGRGPIELVRSESALTAALSPDGRWLAYATLEEGDEEVYVTAFDGDTVADWTSERPFLEGAPRWQLSRAGGTRPRWSADGAELFYISADNVLMSVAVEVGPATLRGAPPRALFRAPVRFRDYSFDVHPSGERFLLNTHAVGSRTPLVLVQGWADERASDGGDGTR